MCVMYHSGVLLMTIPQELCHQPEVNRFLNIATPLPAGPASVDVFADLPAPHERPWVNISSAQLSLIYTSPDKKREACFSFQLVPSWSLQFSPVCLTGCLPQQNTSCWFLDANIWIRMLIQITSWKMYSELHINNQLVHYVRQNSKVENKTLNIRMWYH